MLSSVIVAFLFGVFAGVFVNDLWIKASDRYRGYGRRRDMSRIMANMDPEDREELMRIMQDEEDMRAGFGNQYNSVFGQDYHTGGWRDRLRERYDRWRWW